MNNCCVSFQVSEVAHTKATGDLRCHNVIHTVGPLWFSESDEDKCAALLLTTFENVLNYAEQTLEAESLALPAVGTGKLNILQQLLTPVHLLVLMCVCAALHSLVLSSSFLTCWMSVDLFIEHLLPIEIQRFQLFAIPDTSCVTQSSYLVMLLNGVSQ